MSSAETVLASSEVHSQQSRHYPPFFPQWIRSPITGDALSNGTPSTSGWGVVTLLNSATVDLATMANSAFTWRFTTSPRTAASITQISGSAIVYVNTASSLGSGTGSLAGAITFAAGSRFLFNAAGPLTVPGSVSFADASSFGIEGQNRGDCAG